MMKQFLLICTSIATLGLSATVTNVIDIAALAACGTGDTNGWTVCGLDSYSGKCNIKLNATDDMLQSPEFYEPIREIIIEAKASSTSARRLIFTPFINGAFDSTAAIRCSYPSKIDSYQSQNLAFPDSVTAYAVKITLDDDYNSGVWGISKISIVTDDAELPDSPFNLSISAHTTRCRVGWINDGLTVSNRISIFRINHTPESYSLIEECNFEVFTNLSGNVKDLIKNGDLSTRFENLSGEMIYIPANTCQMIQISTGKENGRLTHCGFPDCSSLSMEISSKRYLGDNNLNCISAYYVDSQSVTNLIGSVSATDEFTRDIIPLKDVPSNTAINLGNLDGTKSNRRFLIDRIRFLKDYTPVSATTNFVRTVNAFSAISPGENSKTIGDLEPESVYLITISAFDVHGRASAPSVPLQFTTGRIHGTIYTIY